MVHPLPDKLNGRLGSIDLQGWHVQVVNEEHLTLAKGRAKHTFTPARQVRM